MEKMTFALQDISDWEKHGDNWWRVIEDGSFIGFICSNIDIYNKTWSYDSYMIREELRPIVKSFSSFKEKFMPHKQYNADQLEFAKKELDDLISKFEKLNFLL